MKATISSRLGTLDISGHIKHVEAKHEPKNDGMTLILTTSGEQGFAEAVMPLIDGGPVTVTTDDGEWSTTAVGFVASIDLVWPWRTVILCQTLEVTAPQNQGGDDDGQ